MPRLTSIYYSNLRETEARKTEIRGTKGNTLYIGSRDSDQYGRIYDKGLEADMSPVAGAIWRYEIEYKGKRAQQVLNRLMVERCPKKGITPLVISHIWSWFNDRNFPPLFERNMQGVIETHLRASDPDEERVLTWFRTQVKPAVLRMITHRRTDVLEALGLDEADPSKWSPSI
jgi:DNA relaxase NicK